jgi:hypothetical protein
MKSNPMKARAGFDAANATAAGAILQDPQRYGGASAGLVQWARLFIAKREERTSAEEAA